MSYYCEYYSCGLICLCLYCLNICAVVCVCVCVCVRARVRTCVCVYVHGWVCMIAGFHDRIFCLWVDENLVLG